MKKIRIIVSALITSICISSFFIISLRLISKEILVDALDIRNEKISLLADYTWGDQLSRHQEKACAPGYSKEYAAIRAIYDSTISETALTDEDHVTDNDVSVQEYSLLNKYEMKIDELKDDINNYCNHHFILRPILTDLKLLSLRILGWNMAFAREDEDEYMLQNGVVNQAVIENDNIIVDTTIKDAADKYGVNYIFLQYPYRVNSSDSFVPYGVSNQSNENADKYLNELSIYGASIIDLRKELTAKGWNNHKGYYLTDSHWTTDSGFMSAGIISEYLAKHYDGFVFNREYYEESSYTIKAVNLNNPMVRETVNLYIPKFDTDFRFICLESDKKDDIEKKGGLIDALFDMNRADNSRFSNVLTAYSASCVGTSLLTETKNEMSTEHFGRVLFVSNSFSWHIIPYLALDCDEVIFLHIDAKNYAEGIIEKYKPDVVIEAPF